MKSFIIHLSKFEASKTTALALKAKLEEFNMPVELFEGTYGNDAVGMMEDEGREVHHWGIKGPGVPMDSEHPSFEKITRPGVKGCFYSHYKLWQKCVELNEPIIIWEDDIVLTRPFIPVEWKEVLVLALGHQTKSAKYMYLLENPRGVPAAIEYLQASMPGCCGYAIQPDAAQKLLNEFQHSYLPADNAINQYIVNIEIHNYIMGIALVKKDGKRSLTTNTDIWSNNA
jgi:GR25 family glycosyltransferase involved in LPS biosynthesis